MSNLSDLLPAGGGAKVITATADGNLATGQTVALQSNGTVKGVSSTARSISEAVGSAAVYESATSDDNSVAYDPTNKKLLIVYSDAGNSGYGTAVVATLSGSTLTYGTPAVFHSASCSFITAVYSSGAGKFVVTYKPGSGGNSIVATVSGTTVSFGSTTQWSSNNLDYHDSAYDSGNDKVVVTYGDGSQSDHGYSAVGTVSGTSITFGSAVEYNNGNVFQPGLTYDSTSGKVVVVYGSSSTNTGRAQVGTVSGTSISWGSAGTYGSNEKTRVNRAVHDVGQNKIFVAYRESADVFGIIGTVSGTSISFGTRDSMMTAGTTNFASLAYHTAAQKVVYSGRKSNVELTAIICTVSGTTFSKGSDIKLANSGDENGYSAYDSTEEQVVVAYRDVGNSNYGTAITITPAYTATNSSDFAGITNQAINNSASGEVVVEGGVITNGSLLPLAYSGSVGSEVVFEAARADYSMTIFDSSNNKVVIVYADNGDSAHGKAIVGTVSGSSVSYGTAVTFNAATTTRISGTFDSNSNKVVVAFRDDGDSGKTKSIIGTVSGTSISFGSEATITTNTTGVSTSTTFDSNSNKVVVFYRDDSNSEYGTAAVGTVSGTSISFGTPVVFESAGTGILQSSSTFDSSTNKTVVAYRDVGNSSHGTAIIGTVSGTSISFGTAVVFHAASTEETFCTFDSGNSKVVVGYRDNAAPKALASRVGTVSGTSISFGTEATVQSITGSIGYAAISYSPDAGAVVIVYSDSDNSSYGTYAIGAVSGTDITYETPVVFAAASTEDCGIAYDTNADKFLVSFKDTANSNYGTSIVLTVTAAVPNFTIGSTYYVQDDGTLSTTSSSVTAGKAIANTTLLLKG